MNATLLYFAIKYDGDSIKNVENLSFKNLTIQNIIDEYEF